MDRLQSMRVFVKVVEQGSFVAAASALGLSNAVVKRLVADLETYLGIRLLNRSTRRMSLTDAGHAYRDRLIQILNDIEEADSAASELSRTPGGTLSVFSQTGFGQTILPGLLRGYSQRYPDVTLDISLSERPVDLVEEGFDAGLFVTPQKHDSSTVIRRIASAEVILCASPGYLEKYGAPHLPEDLQHHACLNYSPDHLRPFWEFENADGTITSVPIRSRMTSNNSFLIGDCVRNDMGIAKRASYMVEEDLAQGRLIQILPEHKTKKLHIYLGYPSRRLVSATVRSFIDFIIGEFPDPEVDL